MSTTILGLGRPDLDSIQAWNTALPGSTFLYYAQASPNGLRGSSRILGIGFDAAVAATLARSRGEKGPILALNPWTGVACVGSGFQSVAVTGIYSTPGSASWRVLHRTLGRSAVIALSDAEAQMWRAEGGNALSVLYGGTTGVGRCMVPTDRVDIFAGGTSDRDESTLEILEEEVLTSSAPVTLTIADGSGPSLRHGRVSSVRRLPYVNRDAFLEHMRCSHVCVLPLRESSRAAGQMVLCAAAEAGLPVVASDVQALSGYRDMNLFTPLESSTGLLDQLLCAAWSSTVDSVELTHQRWSQHASVLSYTNRVVSALAQMGWPRVSQ